MQNLIKLIRIKLIYLAYWFSLICYFIVPCRNSRKKTYGSSACLCIEAGTRGWNSIEFKEYYRSAQEYLGEDCVVKLELTDGAKYLDLVNNSIRANNITHYLYDPRTGSQNFWHGLYQSFVIGLILKRNNVIPIALATDISVRRWRVQVAIVTAFSGHVMCFLSAKMARPMFPHDRLTGPCLMPFSKSTLSLVAKLRAQKIKNENVQIIFSGSLYEPRTTTLNKIRQGLLRRGIELKIMGRELGSPRVSDFEYWARLVNADIVVTTTDQMFQPGTDNTHIAHLVYRYLEVTACGALLVAQHVPAVERYFSPGDQFITFSNIDEAIDKIHFLCRNAIQTNMIALSGLERAEALIESRSFWTGVDSALGASAMR